MNVSIRTDVTNNFPWPTTDPALPYAASSSFLLLPSSSLGSPSFRALEKESRVEEGKEGEGGEVSNRISSPVSRDYKIWPEDIHGGGFLALPFPQVSLLDNRLALCT